jgi:hypothetical protein
VPELKKENKTQFKRTFLVAPPNEHHKKNTTLTPYEKINGFLHALLILFVWSVPELKKRNETQFKRTFLVAPPNEHHKKNTTLTPYEKINGFLHGLLKKENGDDRI